MQAWSDFRRAVQATTPSTVTANTGSARVFLGIMQSIRWIHTSLISQKLVCTR
jgi:hypothetical protein